MGKYSLIAIVSLLSILTGSQAQAWRRACVYITKIVYPYNLNNDTIILFTPKWVSLRHIVFYVLWILSSILAFLIINWKIALGLLALNFILVQLVSYLFPNKKSQYYLNQIIEDFLTRREMYKKFEDTDNEQEMQRRLELLYKAFQIR